VRVREEARTESEAVLHFTVSDTGIGIPREKQTAIFSAFVQADGSMTRRYGGTGLGLAIASQLVDLMGGRIWVESEVDRGSTFHFTTCLALGEEGKADGPDLAPAMVRDVRVLVVDDSSTSREILAELLGAWGMRPLATPDGPTALAALRRAQADGAPFALAVQMPGMDGPALVERIRQEPPFARTGVILLASGRRPEGGRTLGDVGYLMKPIVKSHLLETIQALLGGRAVEKRRARPVHRKTGPALHVLLAEDNTVNRRVVCRLLEKRGHTVVAVEDGRQAVAALEAERFEVVLMDVQMPEMDGFQATRAVRAGERLTGTHVPIIALTAHAMTGDRERCLAAGMDAYVAKPVEAVKLFATIEQLAPDPSNDSVDALVRRGEPPVLDREAALARLGGDSEVLLDAVAAFCEDRARLLADVRTGILKRDGDALRRAAHTLKGALSAIGAVAATEAAIRVERLGREGELGSADEACAALEPPREGLTA